MPLSGREGCKVGKLLPWRNWRHYYQWIKTILEAVLLFSLQWHVVLEQWEELLVEKKYQRWNQWNALQVLWWSLLLEDAAFSSIAV